MSADNLIEIARQADAIFGDQDDGVEAFETQMRRALARSCPVGSNAIKVLLEDIEAAMFMCGHELIRSRDAAGNLHYRVGGLVGVAGTQPVDRQFCLKNWAASNLTMR
jgi:hypothetical protein